MGIADSKALVQVLRISGIRPCFNERERHVPTPFAGRFSDVVLALLCVVLCVVLKRHGYFDGSEDIEAEVGCF